ncbi:MAG: class I SAM-dependent methyltransferase [Verrucomicrobia bacterium]|nr:class I SAM-dependent methyltransferase [Verrucomicrobiota bacterium]
MNRCLVCQGSRVRQLVDFGTQPISHHFLAGSGTARRYPLALGQCDDCCLVQLLGVISAEELVPQFDWIRYNEPEFHLDAMVDSLCLRLPPGATICGLSHKDDSTLRRFRDRGFENTHRLDLGIADPRAGVETIQDRLRPENLDLREPVDLVVARHILEHSHNPLVFMGALRKLIKPSGYVAVEIPDTRLPFDLLDYTVLWEDHSLYFSESTLRETLKVGGFQCVAVTSYSARYETAVVAVVRPGEGGGWLSMDGERERANRFAQAYPRRRNEWRELLTNRGRVALFGAGHHASVFTNLMGVADLIEFIVDDSPNKCGLRMPGTELPIVGSERLSDIEMCLSSLGDGSERAVLAQLQPFIRRGGIFASIFPSNPNSPFTLIGGEL